MLGVDLKKMASDITKAVVKEIDWKTPVEAMGRKLDQLLLTNKKILEELKKLNRDKLTAEQFNEMQRIMDIKRPKRKS